MLRKVIHTLVILVMVGCSPAYASGPGDLTEQHCKTVKVIARQILIDLQQGQSQYEIMDALNKRPMTDFGQDGNIVKLYLQVNVSAFSRNVNKSYRVGQILTVVENDCKAQISVVQ